jgi:DNA-binding MarR family transcriptional regulator
MPTDRSVILTWRSLHFAEREVRRVLDERLAAKAGCSLLEHDLLAWLAAVPGQRLQMLDLADRLGVTRGGLTRIVDRLVERGWLARDRPENNRREVYAHLTPDGQRAVKRARATYLTGLAETLGTHLDKQDLHDLARITTRLLDGLAPGEPGCQPYPRRTGPG